MPSSFGSCTKAAYQAAIYAVYTPITQPVELAPQGLIGNPYMFTGRRFDLETGLYYYRARYYNPHIGRFLQTDPIGYGYNYCGNNSLNYLDPLGLIRVAFYDGQDTGNDWDGDGISDIATGTDLSNMANDPYFDKTFDMGLHEGYDSATAYVIGILTDLANQGIIVDEVFFFDHSGPSRRDEDGILVDYEVSFGNEWIKVDNPSEEEKNFWNDLGNILPENSIINFRGCSMGARVEKLAELTHRAVTGVDGYVQPDTNYYNNPTMPNYHFDGPLRMAHYDGDNIVTEVS
jgi:RHS repeat-associated protein